MYHPGKVLKIFSPKDKDIVASDDTTQAMLAMWDENLITVSVEPHLSDKTQEGDVVLVDYSPLSPKTPVPRMIVIKVLRGENAEKTWSEYKSRFKKLQEERAPLPPFQMPQIPRPGPYG